MIKSTLNLIFCALFLASKSLADTSSYSSYNWVLSSSGFSNDQWTLQVSLEHATKICGLVASGSEPNLVIVPVSRNSKTLTTQHLLGKFDSNECFFEAVLDVAGFYESSETDSFQKLEIFIDELYSPAYEIKVEKTRFTLPVHSFEATKTLTQAQSEALTFSTAGDLAFPLEGFQGYASSFSSILPFQYSDGKIYLTTPHVFSDSNTVLTSIDMSTETAIHTIDCSSDSKGASFGYAQEVAGFLFQRQNDEFNVYSMPSNSNLNRTNGYGFDSADLASAMNSWNDCPIDIIASPNHFKNDYIAFSFPTTVESWNLNFENNTIATNSIGTFPGVLSIAFRGDKDDYLYVLSGAAGDHKKIRSCDLSAASANDCHDSTPIYWIVETGADSVTLRISAAQKPLQTQFLYSNTGALNLMALGGNSAVASPYNQIVASPYNNNDFFALNSAGQSIDHVYGVFDSTSGALTHFEAAQISDLSADANIATILGTTLKSANEPCVYFIDTTDSFKSSCFPTSTNYAKSSKVTYHTSISNNIFDFKLSDSNNLASIQEPINYDFMQSHIYLGRSANSPDTAVSFNIMDNAVVFLDSVRGTNSSDRFVLSNNTDLNGSTNSGTITENSVYTDSSDSINNMGNFAPGKIDSISYVAFKYKDSNDNIMVESLPIQVGCAKNMQLHFDYQKAMAKSGEDRKLNFDISQKYILMEDDEYIEDKRLILSAEEGVSFNGAADKGAEELVIYKYNFDDTLFPKFKVINSVTGQEFPFSDKMQLTVVGAINVHKLFMETDYEDLYDLAYPDANTHISDHQYYKDYYVKQALGEMHYNDEGIFDDVTKKLHNGHNQYYNASDNVGVSYKERLTYFIAQKNLLKLSDSSREIGMSTCTYSTDPENPGIGCDLLDESQDRSIIAAVNFNCPFDSACDVKKLPWRFSKHMGTFLLEFWNSLPLLMSPSYVLKIKAQTSDSENMCDLETYFYVHVEGVGVNVITSLFILLKWIIYSFIATIILYILNVKDQFVYKNITAFFKAMEIYLKHNTQVSMKSAIYGKDAIPTESTVHFDDDEDSNAMNGRTSMTKGIGRTSVITNKQSMAIQKCSQNQGMTEGYQSFSDTFKQVNVARESVILKNKAAQEVFNKIVNNEEVRRDDTEIAADNVRKNAEKAAAAVRLSQAGRMSQAGMAAAEVKRASMMGEMSRNRRMSVGVQQAMQGKQD